MPISSSWEYHESCQNNGGVLDASMKEPYEVDMEEITKYDLIGFGSGIYNGKHHRRLFKLLHKIHAQNHKKVIIFSTSTIPMKIMHKPLKKELVGKGFEQSKRFCYEAKEK